MTYYYRIINERDGSLLGFISSFDLRYYNEKNHRMLCCLEDKAQYIWCNNQIYRTYTFSELASSYEKKYQEATAVLSAEEEYMEWLEKQNSEQK